MTGNLKDKCFLVGIFFSFFLACLFSLFPVVPPRDSAELAAVAATLGIGHPPGYPLYVLLGKIFIIFSFFGNIAYRLNLMSAVFCAASLSFLFFFLRKNKLSLLPALTAVCFLGFSPFFIKAAIAAEVFSLNVFLALILIFVLQNYSFFLLIFLFGLGLGNHHTLVLLIPGIFYYIVSPIRENKFFTLFSTSTFTCFILFLLGFSIYFYLPLRSQQSPLLNWGRPDNFKNFVRIISRADYGSFQLTASSQVRNFFSSLKQFLRFFHDFYSAFTFLGILLALAGFIYLFRSRQREAIFWLLVFFFTGPFLIIWANLPFDQHAQAILERFYLLPGAAFSLFIGWGAEYLLIVGRDRAFRRKIILCCLSLFLVFFAGKNLFTQNRRNNFVPYDLARNIFRLVEPNSFLAVSGDSPQFLLTYLQAVEQKRKDLRLFPEIWVSPWGIKELRLRWPQSIPDLKNEVSVEEFLRQFFYYNYSRYPIYLLGFKNTRRFQAVPLGLVDKVVLEKGLELNYLPQAQNHLDHLLVEHRKIAAEYNRSKKPGADYFTVEILDHYAIAYNRLGITYLEEGLTEMAMNNFKKAIELNPEDSQAHNNLGNVYFKTDDYAAAVKEFKEAVKLDSNNAEAYNNLGSVYGVLEDYPQAAKMFAEALKINPAFALAEKNYQLVNKKLEQIINIKTQKETFQKI